MFVERTHDACRGNSRGSSTRSLHEHAGRSGKTPRNLSSVKYLSSVKSLTSWNVVALVTSGLKTTHELYSIDGYIYHEP